MERREHSPWEWQTPFGFVQGVEVSQPTRVLECSGQVAFDPEGQTMHPGDMGRQISAALDNLEAVLAAADMSLANVAKVTTFVTDIAGYIENRPVMMERMAAAGARHTHTLIGVAELARPDLVVEIDVVAYA